MKFIQPLITPCRGQTDSFTLRFSLNTVLLAGVIPRIVISDIESQNGYLQTTEAVVLTEARWFLAALSLATTGLNLNFAPRTFKGVALPAIFSPAGFYQCLDAVAWLPRFLVPISG